MVTGAQVKVFSTHVEMNRQHGGQGLRRLSFLYARGDEPEIKICQWKLLKFSLRTWR